MAREECEQFAVKAVSLAIARDGAGCAALGWGEKDAAQQCWEGLATPLLVGFRM